MYRSEKVLFEGNNYSEEWEKEAEKRGLPNVKTTPLALDAMVTDKAKKLFEHNNVYTHAELEARHEIELEKYVKKVQIEARIMGELATSHILPPAIHYQNTLDPEYQGFKRNLVCLNPLLPIKNKSWKKFLNISARSVSW